MLKRKDGNASIFIMIIVIGLIILISIYLYGYITSGQIEIPQFQGSYEEENEIQIAGKEDKNITNPLNMIDEGKQKEEIHKYHYQQIDQNAKIIYKALEENIENMRSGTYTIEFEDQFSKLLEKEEGTDELNKVYQIALDAFSMDHPEVFYLDITKMIMTINTKTTLFGKSYKVKIGNDENSTYLIDGFYGKEQVEEAVEKVKVVENQIIKQVEGKSDYQKVKYAHDWIVEQISYDKTISRKNTRNVYGSFVEQQVVCEGYAKAFQMLLNDMNIPSMIVVGKGTNSEGRTESHAWNYIRLDGKWYGVDTTWDDPIIIGGTLTQNLKYKYFLKGSGTFSKNHFETGLVSNKGMIFDYPQLEAEDYK